eukprot:symbB.v1.2.002515.t1/scaffold132.1/size310437/26
MTWHDLTGSRWSTVRITEALAVMLTPFQVTQVTVSDGSQMQPEPPASTPFTTEGLVAYLGVGRPKVPEKPSRSSKPSRMGPTLDELMATPRRLPTTSQAHAMEKATSFQKCLAYYL